MSDYAHRERKNRIIGISVSIGIHILLLVLFLWVRAWQEPYPPLPEYGIELNMGIDNQGSGSEAVAVEETQEIEESPELESEETTEETITENNTETEVSKEAEEVSEPTEEIPELDSQLESPVETEEKVSEKKQEPQKKEETKQVEKPKANPNALFPGKETTQGETNDTSGDQGNPEGEVEAEAMMGPQGGGSGSKLDMSGWKWDSPPRPDDPTQQSGKIVFEIRVDSNGEVISVRAIETTVSAEVVKIYQDEVAKLSFSRTSGGKTAPQSKGTITFLIRSN